MKDPFGLKRLRSSAEEYVFLESSFFKKATQKERQWVLSNILKLRHQDARILDVGCGGGFLLDSLLEFRQASMLYGIDISSSLIRFAKKRTRANFVLASASKLPFKAGTFDIMVMINLLHHIINVKGAVPDMMRVLKSSGDFIIVEQGVPSRITSTLAYIYTKVLTKLTKQPWTVRFLTPKKIRILFPHVKKMHVKEYFSPSIFGLKCAQMFLVAGKIQVREFPHKRAHEC